MYTLITVLIIIICILLMLSVLVQNSKGGGIAGGLASSAQVMGVRKTTDFLEKLTWGLASALIVLSLISNFTLPTGIQQSESMIKEQIDNTAAPVQPSMPAPGNPAAPKQPQSAAPSPAGSQTPGASPAPAPANSTASEVPAAKKP
jgi:preprotein translocase subunit SecG